MAEVMPHSFYRWMSIIIPCTIGFFLLLYWALPATKPTGSLATMLIGDRLLILELPAQPKYVERIEVNKDQTAARGFFPIHDPRAVTIVPLPNDVWSELDTLRASWCDKSPIFPIPQQETAGYELAIKCQGIVGRDFRIPADQLPHALTTLISTVPSAPVEKE